MYFRFFVLMIFIFSFLFSCGDDKTTTPTKTAQISSISPTSGKVGDVITISGVNFGTIQDTSFITFNLSKTTEIISWSDIQIVVKVPIGAISGKVSITVNNIKSNEVDFEVLKTEPINYESVTIGSQVWMLKNLDVDTYRNGDPIPEVTDLTELFKLTTGAWCYYDNDPANGAIYGKLYNWYAVNDPRGLAPDGYHIPTDAEWKELEMCLGMSQIEADRTGERGTDEGGKLKEVGTSHWLEPNWATNSSGFSALPGGYTQIKNFISMKEGGGWWTSSVDNTSHPYCRYLYNDRTIIYRNFFYTTVGFSVRCVMDK
jgi:uncharacterized protein (TIGR02145 family)